MLRSTAIPTPAAPVLSAPIKGRRGVRSPDLGGPRRRRRWPGVCPLTGRRGHAHCLFRSREADDRPLDGRREGARRGRAEGQTVGEERGDGRPEDGGRGAPDPNQDCGKCSRPRGSRSPEGCGGSARSGSALQASQAGAADDRSRACAARRRRHGDVDPGVRVAVEGHVGSAPQSGRPGTPSRRGRGLVSAVASSAAVSDREGSSPPRSSSRNPALNARGFFSDGAFFGVLRGASSIEIKICGYLSEIGPGATGRRRVTSRLAGWPCERRHA